MLNPVKPYARWSRKVIQLALTGALMMVIVSVVAAAGMPAAQFPSIIPLPAGFQPEGIATGRGTSFYAGSLADGSVYGGDLRTGQGEIVVPPQAGRIAVGLKVDVRTNSLFVAGGLAGAAHVYDAETGDSLASYQLAPVPFDGTFVNDVVVTRDAAYFTDSFRPYLYRLPLGPRGSLPDLSAVEPVMLGGEYDFVPGPFVFNANGIDATADGEWLLIVNSMLGTLYRVDPETGYATEIDLGGDTLPNGDGILLAGQTLYVVQNRLNQIAVVHLDDEFDSGMVEDTITNTAFRVPTTVASFGDALYAVNARFGTPATPDTEYEAVRVPIH